MAASCSSRQVSSVPDVGVGLPQASWGGGEVVGGAAPVARRVQSRERIKGRTKLLTPHVLLRLRVAFSASSLLRLQVSVGDGPTSPLPRLCPGIVSLSGAWDDQQSLLSGLGSGATAGRRCFVGCEGRDEPLAAQGGKTPPLSLLLLAMLNLSGIGGGTRLPENWFV